MVVVTSYEGIVAMLHKEAPAFNPAIPLLEVYPEDIPPTAQKYKSKGYSL